MNAVTHSQNNSEAKKKKTSLDQTVSDASCPANKAPDSDLPEEHVDKLLHCDPNLLLIRLCHVCAVITLRPKASRFSKSLINIIDLQ